MSALGRTEPITLLETGHSHTMPEYEAPMIAMAGAGEIFNLHPVASYQGDTLTVAQWLSPD
jgi:hypothetical protein